MLSPVSPNSPRAVEAAQQPVVNDRVLEEKISKIDATQIELVGLRIASHIASNLGEVRKAVIEQEVAQKKGAPLSKSQLIMLELQRKAANEKMKEGVAEFFSEEDYGKFYMAILGPLKDLISEKFSMPSSFLERGLYDRLSDYRPQGILAKTAREIGINLDSKHVPLRYDIHLVLERT